MAIRRRLSFGLRTMFVVVTAVACWLGWQSSQIAHRKRVKATIAEHGGAVVLIWGTPNGIPLARQWMGDRPAAYAIVRTKADFELTVGAFPEADEIVLFQ